VVGFMTLRRSLWTKNLRGGRYRRLGAMGTTLGGHASLNGCGERHPTEDADGREIIACGAVIMWCDDHHHAYVVGFATAALHTSVPYVVTQAVFGSEAERDHYAARLQGRIDHEVTHITGKLFQTANVPEVPPGQ
jgi:hypothetical protein